MPTLLKLKDNLIAEPLVNHWHAWCNLISPVTFSMMTQNLLIPIMESYIRAPTVHHDAAQAHALQGGPFVNANHENFLNQTKALLEYTRDNLNSILQINFSIKKLNTILIAHEKGLGFSNLYEKIPTEIKGLVELVYDLNNNPSIRVIEPLLYQTNFYNKNLQSLLLYEGNIDQRPFSLSTPRFANDNSVEIKKPFHDPFYDALFAARFTPIENKAAELIYEQYELSKCITFKNFKNFFTESGAAPLQSAPLEGIQYFGHACILIRTKEITILVDPLISYQPPVDQQNLDRFSFNDLPAHIDYVLITHGHLDHAVLETLLQIRMKIKNIIVPKNSKGHIQDPSLKLFLIACGFKNVFEIDELEEIHFSTGRIVSIPFLGEHADLNIQAKTAYAVQLKNKNIVCVADSNNLDPQLYVRVHNMIGDVDILFVGMESEGAPMSWLYGPLLLQKISRSANQSRRLNGSNMEKAYALTQSLRCKRVYVYAMGLEPWVSFISSLTDHPELKQVLESNQFIQTCHRDNIYAERLFKKKYINFTNEHDAQQY